MFRVKKFLKWIRSFAFEPRNYKAKPITVTVSVISICFFIDYLYFQQNRHMMVPFFGETISIVPFCETVDCNLKGADKYWECKPNNTGTQKVEKPKKDKGGKKRKCSQKKRKCLKDCTKLGYPKICNKIKKKNFKKKRNCKQCRNKCGNKSKQCLKNKVQKLHRGF